MGPGSGADAKGLARPGEGAPVVVVDEGRPDGARRPLSGTPPYPGRAAFTSSTPPVTWVGGGTRLAITTWGSSSAPTVPTAALVDGQRLTLTVTLRNPGGGPISADVSPYVTVIETPSGLSPRARTVVLLHGQEYDLPPAVDHGGG